MTTDQDELADRKRARADVAQRAYLLFVGTVATACLAITAYISVQNAAQGKDNRATLNAIRDCTQPSGGCYKRGQEQTASAVSNINRVVILAAACSAGLPASQSVTARQNAIQSCVITRLAKHREQ